MTGEKRYAKKLRDALIHYGTLSRWAGDAHRDPPWHSELNTARFCYGYALGYDSIYDFLSEHERKTIAGSMVRLGIKPTLDDWILGEKRIHALDSMGHNWWSVCVSMAGLAALSVLDDVPHRPFRSFLIIREISCKTRRPISMRKGLFMRVSATPIMHCRSICCFGLPIRMCSANHRRLISRCWRGWEIFFFTRAIRLRML